MGKWIKAILELSVAGGLGYLSGGPAGAATASGAYLYRNRLITGEIYEDAKTLVGNYLPDRYKH